MQQMLNTKKATISFIFLFIFFQINSVFGQNVPPAPTGFRVTATECGKISLAWDQYPSGQNPTAFEIFRSNSNTPSTYEMLISLSGNVLSYSDQLNLDEGAESYNYKVRAFFNSPNTYYTNYSNPILTRINCTTPQNLAIVSESCGSVSLTWDAAVNLPDLGIAVSYEIQRNNLSQPSPLGDRFFTIGYSGANYYTDNYPGLSNGQFKYRVKAKYSNAVSSNYSSEVTSNQINCPSPTGLRVSEAICGKISLAWDDYPAGINKSGYRILRSENGSSISNILADVDTNTLTYNDLYGYPSTPGATFYYQIVGKFENSLSDKSNAVNAAVTCPTPQGLTISSASCGQINLSWNDISGSVNETGYTIWRSDSDNGNFFPRDNVGANVTSFTDKATEYPYFQTGKNYSYKITASFNQGQSDFSNIVTISTNCTAPQNFKILPTSNCVGFSLQWDPITYTPDVFGYEIYRSDNINDNFTLIGRIPANLNTITDQYENEHGKTYTYKIRAVITQNLQQNLTSEFAQTSGVFQCMAPTNFRVTSNECGKIDLAWDAYTPALTNLEYQLQRADFENGIYYDIANLNANTLNFSIQNNPTPNKMYFYKLRIKNGNKTSDTAQLSAAMPCSSPSSFRVVNSDCGNINLTWNAYAGTNQPNAFKIYKSENNDFSTERLIATAEPNLTSFTDTGLSTLNELSFAGKNYQYRISAIYNNIETAKSNPITASFNCPNAPTPVISFNTCERLTISWSDFPAGIEESGFAIFRASTENGYYQQIGQVGANTLRYDYYPSPQIKANNSYFYKISGLFNQNNSLLSNYVQASNNCPILESPQITYSGCDKVTLTWKRPTAIEYISGYDIYRSETVYEEDFEKLNYNPVSELTFDDYYMPKNKTIYYKIKYYTGNKSSLFSKMLTVTIDCKWDNPDFRVVNSRCGVIDFAWNDINHNGFENSYKLYRLLKNESGDIIERKIAAYIPAGSTTYQYNGQVIASNNEYNEFKANENYYFYLAAYWSNDKDHLISNEVQASFTCNSNITASVTSNYCEYITVSWTDVGAAYNISNYVIFKSVDGPNGNYKFLTTAPSNYFNINDTSPKFADITYYYKVYPAIINGSSLYVLFEPSNIAQGSYNCNASVTINSITKSCSGITLQWTKANTTNPIDYHIYRANNNQNGEFIKVGEVTREFNTFTDNSAISGQTYFYKIYIEHNHDNLSEPSNIVSETINCGQSPILNITSTSCGEIKLDWNTVLEPNTSYTLYKSEDSNNWPYSYYRSFLPNVNEFIDKAGFSNYGEMTLLSGKNYYYKIEKTKTGVIPLVSNIVTASFSCNNKPNGLKVIFVDCNRIKLQWDPAINHGKSNQYYAVYRSSNGINGDYVQINVSNTYNYNFQELTFADKNNLLPSITYFYKIRSFIDNIGSDFCEPVSASISSPKNTLSQSTGPWHDSSTWSCGRLPTSLDEILINNGHTVTIGENLIGNGKNLTNNGVLKLETGAMLKFNIPE